MPMQDRHRPGLDQLLEVTSRRRVPAGRRPPGRTPPGGHSGPPRRSSARTPAPCPTTRTDTGRLGDASVTAERDMDGHDRQRRGEEQGPPRPARRVADRWPRPAPRPARPTGRQPARRAARSRARPWTPCVSVPVRPYPPASATAHGQATDHQRLAAGAQTRQHQVHADPLRPPPTGRRGARPATAVRLARAVAAEPLLRERDGDRCGDRHRPRRRASSVPSPRKSGST